MVMKDDLKKLIDSHWSYVETLLKSHEVHPQVIKACEFHYKSAFEHGYKHCREEYLVAGNATATHVYEKVEKIGEIGPGIVKKESLQELLDSAMHKQRTVSWGE
jgi:hypothetical protein